VEKFDKIDEKLSYLRLNMNEDYHYTINKSTTWVSELLEELNEKMSERTIQQYLAESELDIQLMLKHTNLPPFGDVLVAQGTIDVNFFTECVKTLKEMRDHLNADFKAVFVPNHFAEDEEYSDLSEVFVENDMHDVHFSVKNMANLKDLIHEVIYLNIDNYPTLEVDIDNTPVADNETKH